LSLSNYRIFKIAKYFFKKVKKRIVEVLFLMFKKLSLLSISLKSLAL